LVGNAWAGFGSAFGPLVLLSLLNKKSTWQGAFAGMLVGGVTVLMWVYFDHPFKDWYEMIRIYPFIPYQYLSFNLDV
jgi:SSS family solute:Na+ symporter